jgi:hypothetical protein
MTKGDKAMVQTVKNKIIADATAGERELSVRRLFIVFSAQARKSYRYSATKVAGSEGNTLLARPENEIVTVDCASLADALVELLNETFPSETASREGVNNGGDGFATQQGSRCFDTAIVGNIRKPKESWAMTSRCVFRDHFFVETGSQTRWYLDPCMFTTYSTKNEVMSWKFENGGGPFNSFVKRVAGDPTQVLIRTPLDDPSPKPAGFTSGNVVFSAADFKSDELSALNGKRLNPSWSDSKYETNAAAALAKINKLLREKAGINTACKFP